MKIRSASLVWVLPPALAPGDGALFVPDYGRGIALVDLAHPEAAKRYLPHPAAIDARGIDGMYRIDNDLLAIQNGLEPPRITLLRLDDTRSRIVSARVLEQGTERLGAPTHAARGPGEFYIIANVGWDKIDDQGNLKPGQSFTKPWMLKLPASR